MRPCCKYKTNRENATTPTFVGIDHTALTVRFRFTSTSWQIRRTLNLKRHALARVHPRFSVQGFSISQSSARRFLVRCKPWNFTITIVYRKFTENWLFNVKQCSSCNVFSSDRNMRKSITSSGLINNFILLIW